MDFSLLDFAIQSRFKMINIAKLSNALCQILFLLFILDQIMSQCGIRWRGTCGYFNSGTKTNYEKHHNTDSR